MKNATILLAAFLAMLGMPLGAQTLQPTLDTDSVGVRLLDSAAVKAPFLDLGRPVYDIKLSPQRDYLLVMFRETTEDGDRWDKIGEIGVLRLSDRQLLWTQPYKYSNTSLTLTRRGIITLSGKKVTMLDKLTGNTIWQQKFSPVEIDDSVGVIAGYTGSGRLRGYSIDTGQELWNQRVPHKKNWGWDNAVSADSLHWLVVCDHLTRLNITTGAIDEYEAKTAVTDVKGALLQGLVMAAGAMAGVAATGQYVYTPVYGMDIINGLHSNIWQADSSIFFSDRKHVVRLTPELKPLWQTELPPKTAAHSLLLSDDSLLYQFSFGMGYSGNMPRKAGRPFIAAYDLKTGRQQFINMLSVKKDIVADALITPHCTYMMFDDGMAYKSDLRDSTVTIVPWNEQKYGRLHHLAHDTIYVYYPLRQSFQPYAFDGQYCPVMTERGDVYVVNERLDIWQHFANEQLYSPIYSKGDRRLIYHSYPQPELLLVHELGAPEVRYTAYFRRLCVSPERLYMLCDLQKLYFIDLP